jgi:hypothetical protein
MKVKMFQNVSKCFKMFQNVSKMFQNVSKCFKKKKKNNQLSSFSSHTNQSRRTVALVERGGHYARLRPVFLVYTALLRCGAILSQ